MSATAAVLRAVNDPKAIGFQEREGKRLYRVHVETARFDDFDDYYEDGEDPELSGLDVDLYLSECDLLVWADDDFVAECMSEDHIQPMTLLDFTVTLLFDPDRDGPLDEVGWRLTTLPAFAEPRGQMLLAVTA